MVSSSIFLNGSDLIFPSRNVTSIYFVTLMLFFLAILVTYEYPVLCDIINMSELEKAAGFYHSLLGLGLLLFIPFSGRLTI